MSSSSTSRSSDAPAVASSSRTPPSASPVADYTSDDDNLDFHAQELLRDDPLHDGAIDEDVSFRRNAQRSKPSFASRFLSSPFSGGRNGSTSPAGRNRPRGNTGPTTNTILSYLNSSADASIGLQDSKDASGLDWYVEGPGRRVGYDNLTAIDWIYEYSKERMRLQHLLTNAPGVIGQLRVLADSSQIWLILIATGIAVGGIAAGIDVASDWMGDLKTGVCSNVDNGGKFYLNKTFCCWGEDSMAECKDWRSWGALMGIGNKAGGYIIEYIVFILFAVSHMVKSSIFECHADTIQRSCSLLSPPSLLYASRLTPNNLVSQKSRPFLVASSSGAFWEHGLWLSNLLVFALLSPQVCGWAKKARSYTSPAAAPTFS